MRNVLAMRSKNSRHIVRVAIRSLGGLVLFSLAACESAPPAIIQPQAQAPDTVAQFVSTGRLGQSGVVSVPGGGTEIVVIDTQYNSAAGDVCRTYAVTTSSVQSQHLACGTGADWQEVSPLLTSSN